jgi:hypothetical protein
MVGIGAVGDGAGEGNRTLVFSLGSCCSTIELHPHIRRYNSRPTAEARRSITGQSRMQCLCPRTATTSIISTAPLSMPGLSFCHAERADQQARHETGCQHPARRRHRRHYRRCQDQRSAIADGDRQKRPNIRCLIIRLISAEMVAARELMMIYVAMRSSSTTLVAGNRRAGCTF